MSDKILDTNLVAFCGLYCGECGAYKRKRCKGCKENAKATWCKIRTCCLDNKFSSCADCSDFKNVADCKKFNNFVSKIFGLIFRSDRKACIDQIKACGREKHAQIMSEQGKPSIKRK